MARALCTLPPRDGRVPFNRAVINWLAATSELPRMPRALHLKAARP